MNFGDIKAFQNEQPPSAKPSAAINKQLQEEGLRQAANFQAAQAGAGNAAISVISSQTTVGLKIYSGSMQQNVTVNNERAKNATEFEKDKPASLFDFEKVAENVMRFVGGVIKGAANSGADEAKINDLFSQAREGIAKGIKMAERDIGGFMNEEISNGIANSRALLDKRVAELENELLGLSATEQTAVAFESLQASSENSGELLIRTRDGDEVTLSFTDLKQVSLENQVAVTQTDQLGSDESDYDENAGGASFSQSLVARTLEFSGYRIEIKGDLDDDELNAISDLVNSANDLADTFYRGDIQSAFNQALELGYDDQELVGFALQLNRVEQTQAVKAYGYVQQYNEDDQQNERQEKLVKPVAQYLEKMLSVYEQSQTNLASAEDYNTIINGIVNEMKDVQVPDLVQAINRFHTFNKQLVDALPQTDNE